MLLAPDRWPGFMTEHELKLRGYGSDKVLVLTALVLRKNWEIE